MGRPNFYPEKKNNNNKQTNFFSDFKGGVPIVSPITTNGFA